jgi:uncharacterized protein
MQLVVMIVGAVAEGAGWWAVSARRANVWRLMPAVLGAMGIAAVLTRRPVWAGEPGAAVAVAVGLSSGLVLYLATRVFVGIASMWGPFRSQVAEQYERASLVSKTEALALSLVIMVPAEELFWRGLFQGHLEDSLAAVSAAAFTLLVYVAANAPSRSLPIVAGAIVGGAVWVGLAWWSGGVLASLASHILWTGLMLIAPPGAARAPGESA